MYILYFFTILNVYAIVFGLIIFKKFNNLVLLNNSFSNPFVYNSLSEILYYKYPTCYKVLYSITSAEYSICTTSLLGRLFRDGLPKNTADLEKYLNTLNQIETIIYKINYFIDKLILIDLCCLFSYIFFIYLLVSIIYHEFLIPENTKQYFLKHLQQCKKLLVIPCLLLLFLLIFKYNHVMHLVTILQKAESLCDQFDLLCITMGYKSY